MAGVAVGFVFDFYRSLRKWLGLGKVMTIVGDLIFSLVTLALLFRFFLRANALDLRFYILWGSILGLFLYTRILSRLTLWVFFKVYQLIEGIIGLIMMGLKIPVRAIILLMGPPYALLRWFSLLLYRISETFLAEPVGRTRKRAYSLWERLFPPRTKG